jgi:APA family basic amino acid/polyamine antiporter
MPIGILGSLAVCTVLYLVVATVFTGLVPYASLAAMDPARRAEALTVAMEYVHAPPVAIGIVALGSVAAQTSVLHVFQLGQPRILMAMARDGLLPPVFARVHATHKTPHVATIATGVFVGAVSAVANIDEMVDLTNIGTLFAFLIVCAGIPVLRRTDPDRPRPFRVPLGPWLVPVVGAVSCVVLAANLPRSSWVRFAVWLVVGAVVYAAYGLRRDPQMNSRHIE